MLELFYLFGFLELHELKDLCYALDVDAFQYLLRIQKGKQKGCSQDNEPESNIPDALQRG